MNREYPHAIVNEDDLSGSRTLLFISVIFLALAYTSAPDYAKQRRCFELILNSDYTYRLGAASVNPSCSVFKTDRRVGAKRYTDLCIEWAEVNISS